MKLRNIAGLYLMRLRGRLAQELLALAGIAVGVSLLFAALVANTSLTGSYEKLMDRVVGDARLELTARGSGTVGEKLLTKAQRLPGVARAAAILEEPAEAAGPHGRRSVTLVGLTPEFGAFGDVLKRDFSYGFSYRFLARARAIALPTSLMNSLDLVLGQPVTLALGGRDVRVRVGAEMQEADIGALVNSPVAIAPLHYAQELAGKPGQVSRIFVEPKPSQDGEVKAGLLRLAGRRADVRPANFDATLFRKASLPTSLSTAMWSVFGFLFAFSAMLLTSPQRQRLLVDLRAEGYGTGTVVRVLGFDALVLGIAASTLGIALGDQIARLLFDDTPSYLRYAFIIASERTVSPANVAIAAAGGGIASCVVVLGPMASTLRRPKRRQLGAKEQGARSARPNWLVVTGLGALLAGIAIVITGPASATIGVGGLACLTASMLLLLPSIVRLLVNGLDALTRQVRSVVPFLVIFDLRDLTARTRSFAVAATSAVAVFGSVALQGAHADLLRGLYQTSRDVAGLGEIWALAPGDANQLVTTPFRVPRVASLAGTGIKRLAIFRSGFLDIGDRRVRVLAPPADGPRLVSHVQLLKGDVESVDKRLRAGGWVVVSVAIARDHALDIGDRFALPTPVPATLRVAGLSTNIGWPPGGIVLNADDYARAWGSDDASAILATLSPGISPGAGQRALRALLGPGSALAVATASERQRDQDASGRAGVRWLVQMAALVLICAVIAMASAMAGLIWQRRSFLVGIKVEGYDTAELWRALMLEAGILISAGCVVGVAFGLLGQALVSRALTSVTGFPVVYSPATASALLTCLAVTGAAVVIVVLFGRRAVGVAPESVLGE